MAYAALNKLRLICDRGGEKSFPAGLPPLLILIAECREGAYGVKPGYCQAQFAMTFIFQ